MLQHFEDFCMRKARRYVSEALTYKEQLERQLHLQEPDFPEFDLVELQENNGEFIAECPYCVRRDNRHRYIIRESYREPSIKVFSWEATIKKIPKEAPNVLQFCVDCGTQFCVSLWRFVNV